MRKLKFRAWDNAHKKMIHKVNLYSISQTGVINKAQLDNKQFMNDIGLNCEVMQWSGLIDKNGTEVFEGDILHYKYQDDAEGKGFGECYYQVGFRDGAFGWTGDITKNFYPFSKEPLEDMTVCGNIFENRELLKNYE